MLRLRGDWSFGHVGCGPAVLLHLVSMSLLLGASLVATVAPPWMFGGLIIGGIAAVLLISTPVEYFRRHGPMVRSVEMVLDDGGLRLYVKGAPHYVPLSELDVEVIPPDGPVPSWCRDRSGA